jgi:hypothetical protein
MSSIHAPLASGPGVVLSTTVELHVSCKSLKKMDKFSESDPVCVLYAMSERSRWEEVGRTEIIRNCKDPEFSRFFDIPFFFERVQKLQMAVFDVDNSTPDLSDDDFIGTVFFELGEVVGSHGRLDRPVKNQKGKVTGQMTLTLEEKSRGAPDHCVHIQLSGRKLDDLDTWSKSDPFFVFKRATENGSWLPVFKSETIMNNLNPNWAGFSSSSSALCNGDLDRPLVIEVYDWEKSGQHKLIGACSLSLGSLRPAMTFPLINEAKRERRRLKGKPYENSGLLVVNTVSLTRVYSFLDYMAGGLEIGLAVAIDFTGSNGDPRVPGTLHYRGPPGSNTPSLYEQAILSVGAVLHHYDADGRYPVFGFGGVVNGRVDHCFALSGNPLQPELNGVEGVLAAYQEALLHVPLSGPTLFAPLIRTVAASCNVRKKYTVLLIITDGACMDMAQTVEAIVQSSTLPLSIVIAGVGNADFGDMRRLDGDDARLRDSRGVFAARDIVQFVAMRDYQPGQIAQLTADVLKEIPGQVVDHFKGMDPQRL